MPTAGYNPDVNPFIPRIKATLRQQLCFMADENGVVLLVGLIETHDDLRGLAREIAAIVRRFHIQFERQLTQQIERRSRGPVQIQDLIQVRD
jgi:hypothetical protein